MSRLDPGHKRRLRRTYLLLLVATALAGLAVVLLRPGFSAPAWLSLPIYVTGGTLGVVAIILMFAILGEARHTSQQ